MEVSRPSRIAGTQSAMEAWSQIPPATGTKTYPAESSPAPSKGRTPAGLELFNLLKSHDMLNLAGNLIGAFFRKSQFLPQEIKQNTVADNDFSRDSAAPGASA